MQTKIDLKTGLTTAEVEQRIATGQKNTPPPSLTRSTQQILRDNTLTLFNLINLILGALIVTTGSYRNLLFLGVATFNTIIGIVQELREKHKIDQLSLLAESPLTVIRQQQKQAIVQADIVRDDILFLSRGDQVPADSCVRQTDGLEVDESQLTGEAKPINKTVDSKLLSGSFIVSGQALVQVTAVGQQSFVAKLAHAAKQEKKLTSVLLDTINRIIKVLTFIIVPLGVALFISAYWQRGHLNHAILGTAAATIGMIPEGLVLLTSVALAVSALTLGRRQVLVRTLPAIEALARVDVLCLDKTGTITSGALTMSDLLPVAPHTKTQLEQALAQTVNTLNEDNPTAAALQAALPQPATWQKVQTMPFSSARKWSGVTFAEQGSFIIGAPEYVLPQLTPAQQELIAQHTAKGERVLCLARSQARLTADLPAAIEFWGLILLRDEIRPTAVKTFSYFATQDIAIKVISGDNPTTVANIAQRAGIADSTHFIDMHTQGETADFDQLIRDYTVFGRVSPTQKQQLIRAYQAAGHTVAMTGDGVNDVLALRQADCGVALASGSEAPKSVADFVLLDSNFDAMVHVLNEGRRVINNIEQVAALYLIKTIYSVVLGFVFIFLNQDYPFAPIQLTPIAALTVGIPSFFLAMAPNYQRITGYFMAKVMRTAVPAAALIVSYILFVHLLGGQLQLNHAQTSTLSVLLTGTVSFSALISITRPFNRWKSLLVGSLITAFILMFPLAGQFFSLISLFNWSLALIYLPLICASYPLFRGLQVLMEHFVIQRIHWR